MRSGMKKSLAGGLAVIALASGLAAAPASARDRGGAIAAGVIGGLALGALAGSAAANAQPYGYAPAYAEPQPYYGGGCYYQRQPVVDDYGYVVGHRRVRVCE